MKPFAEVIPAKKVNKRTIEGLWSDQWRLTVWSLYLKAAKYIPDAAKTCTGAAFGYCDNEGRFCAKPDATHFGWTLDPEATHAAD